MKSGNQRAVELLKQQQEAMRIADSHKLSGDSIDWAHASVHLSAAALAAHESDHEFVLQELRKTAPSGADFFLRANGPPQEAPKKRPADDIEVVAKFNPKLRVLEQETFDDFSIHFLGRVKVNPEFKTRTSKTTEAQLGAEKMLQAELAVWENARNLEKEAEREMRDAQQLEYQNQGPRGGPSSRETGGRGGYGGRGPGRIDLAGFGLTKPGGFALGLSHNPATANVTERRYVEPKQAVWSTMGVRKQKLMKNVTQDMGKGVI
jgi:hypothetical protein